MTTKVYNKLVRDKIPEIIAADGATPITRMLSKSEYLEALIDKLFEEAHEFKADSSIEELADLQEVILALADAINIKPSDLAKTLLNKSLARGAFKKRIFLESVTKND
jgi:predicted house-cleaning noncanonical NTP pyrophosphatase (MazG superfamily)